MLMKMSEFVKDYCQDIVEMRDSILANPFKGFRCDEVVDGTSVIFDSNGKEIPVEEIIQLPFKEFCQRFPEKSSMEAFKNYVSAYVVVQGNDLIQEVAIEMAKAKETLNRRGAPSRATFDL